MEELDLKELLNLFWSKIFQILLIVIITTGIGVIYTFGFTTPKYSASTTLVLTGAETTSDAASNSITATDVTLNSKLVSTYRELVRSKKILRQVILGGADLTEDETYIMDYNGDGKVALYDAFQFLRQVILS